MTLPLIVEPGGAPPWLVQGLAIDDGDAYGSVPMGQGAPRKRRKSTAIERLVTVQKFLTPALMAAYNSWYEKDLKAGSLPWTVPLPARGVGTVYFAARWHKPWTATPRKTNQGIVWYLTGELILSGQGQSSGPLSGALASETSLSVVASAALFLIYAFASETGLDVRQPVASTQLASETALDVRQPASTSLASETALDVRAIGGLVAGGVQSVGLSLPSIFTVTVPLVVSTGNLTAVLANQAAHTMLLGPTSGAAAAPTFRTFGLTDLPAQADMTLLANISGGSAPPTAVALSPLLDDVIGTTQGGILFRNAVTWTFLPPAATAGWRLQSGGTGANPSWVAPQVAIAFATIAASATLTLAAMDGNTWVHANSGSALTITVPAHSSVAAAAGVTVLFDQAGAGQLTLAPAAGVTINTSSSLTTRAGKSVIGITQTETLDTWDAFGDLT